ncbi:DUF1669 domain-containing protein [Candidatus Babeliales bacterium]|nr:DUF1669 domain-containing protein [Candidatus Babeliales bacterium]
MRYSGYFCQRILCFFFFFFPIFLYGDTEVFFSPKDKLSSKLIEQINSTKKRIYAAVYMITDIRIARALIEAKNTRNIDVQIVTDKVSVESESGKIDFLKENGIEIFVFKPPIKKYKRFEKKMHNKFALFDNRSWTGSFNWTLSADKRNKENVIYTDDIKICKSYEKEFEELKRSCCLKAKCFSKKNCKIKSKDKFLNKKNSVQDKNLKEKIIELFKQIKMKFAKGIKLFRDV